MCAVSPGYGGLDVAGVEVVVGKHAEQGVDGRMSGDTGHFPRMMLRHC